MDGLEQQPQVQTEEQTTTNDNQQQQQGVAPTIAGDGAQVPQQQAPQAVSYDFKGLQMPEGFVLSEQEQGNFVKVINGMGLSNEQANAIAQYGTEYAKRIADSVEAMHTQQIADWGEAAKKELGAEFDKTVSLCGSAIERLESKIPGLRDALNETGAGNRIEIINLLAEVGKMVNGDPGMVNKVAANGLNNKSNFATKMYPKTDFSKYR